MITRDCVSPSQQGGSSPSVLDRGLDVKSPGVDLDEFSKPCEPNGTTETGQGQQATTLNKNQQETTARQQYR